MTFISCPNNEVQVLSMYFFRWASLAWWVRIFYCHGRRLPLNGKDNYPCPCSRQLIYPTLLIKDGEISTSNTRAGLETSLPVLPWIMVPPCMRPPLDRPSLQYHDNGMPIYPPSHKECNCQLLQHK